MLLVEYGGKRMFVNGKPEALDVIVSLFRLDRMSS